MAEAQRPTVLITRPAAAAAALAHDVRALGFEPLVFPLTEIVPLAVDLPRPERVAALLLTSQNALTALTESHGQAKPEWRDCPLFVVGPGTGERALGAGFADVRPGGAAGDAAALSSVVVRALSVRAPSDAAPGAAVAGDGGTGRTCWPGAIGGEVLHLSGEVVTMDVAEHIRARGLPARRIVVYRVAAVSAANLVGWTDALDRPPTAALHFSPEAARTFAAACAVVHRPLPPPPTLHICLSQRVLDALRERVAGAPDAHATLAAQVSRAPNSQEVLALLGALAAKFTHPTQSRGTLP